MRNGPYGYRSEEDFLKAVDRELAQLEYHDRGGRDPKQQQKALRGKPGSKERLQQVAAVSGVSVDQLQQDWGRTQSGKALVRAVKQMREVGFVGEQYQAALDAVMDLDNADVAEQTLMALPADIAASFEDALAHRIEQRDEALAMQARNEEDARVKRRERTLTEEYDFAERLGQTALDVVDAEMQSIDPEVLYDPELSDEEIRFAARTTAFAARGVEKAESVLRTHDALDAEIARAHGPGSAWNDDERRQWEHELAQSSLEARERATPDLPEVLAQAEMSMKPGRFMPQFDEELRKLSDPPAHAQRLRDLAVEDWEQREGRRLQGR